MILHLDNGTVLLVAGGFYILLPLSTWLVLRMPRQGTAGLWCAGGALGGVGLVLIGLRGRIDDLLSFVVGQPLLAGGALLTAQSLRKDLQKAWPWRYFGLAVLAYAAAMWVLYPLAQAATLGVVIRAVNLCVIVALITAAWQVGRAEASRNAMTIAGAYMVQAIGVMFNMVNAWRGSTDILVVPSNEVTVAVSLLTLLVSLVACMSYLGLALERSERINAPLVQEIARGEERQRQRMGLVALDRDRLLSVLADSLGHAITQPLTAAMVRLQTLQRRLADPVRELQPLQQGAEHLAQDILRASQTVGKIRHLVAQQPIQTVPVELRSLLHDVDLLLRQEAVNRQVVIHFLEDGEPAWVLGDPLQLRHAVLQVMFNAMNAVSSCPIREVRVTLQEARPNLKIRISDSGPGFGPALLQQGHGSLDPKIESLQGIGIFVVRSIVKQHRGSLNLENSAGGGAVVTLEIPRHDPVDSPQTRHRDQDGACL